MTEMTGEVAAEAVENRYVYCLVDTSDVSTLDVDVEGVAGNAISLVEHDGIGAVVHECESLYDSDDDAQVKRWLVAHQRVVDAMGDVFGTPLPVRFDTIIEGDDEAVRAWLSSQAETVRAELETLRGCWEYRIELLWDDEPFRAAIGETDDELQELKQREADSSGGKAFMLEKQYSNRLRERIHEREAELRALLEEQVLPVVVDDTVQDGNANESDDEEHRSVVRRSVLADETEETALGERLDTVAAERGVKVRFTGPWPPYTFAPELG